jgi:hypothetical protein
MTFFFPFKNKNNGILDKNLQNYIDKKNNESFHSFSKKYINPSLLNYKNFSSDFSNVKKNKNVIKAGCICEFSQLCNLHKSNYYANDNDDNDHNYDNNNSYAIYIIVGGTTTIMGIAYFLYYNNFFLYNKYNINVQE